MDLSAKLLREVEFRTSLRGYDTDEVDEFLEKVAVAVEELQEKMRQLAYRAEQRSGRPPTEPPRRMTTASAALSFSRSGPLISPFARPKNRLRCSWTPRGSESDKLLADARGEAQRLTAEAQRRHPTTCPGSTASGPRSQAS